MDWVLLQEIINLIGLKIEDLPPPVATNKPEGGLVRTPLGDWVIEVPANLSREDAIALYLHNVAHFILKHHLRCLFKGDPAWDSACDYIANGLLVSLLTEHFKGNPKIREIACKLHPYRKEYVGMSAESLYLLLRDKALSFGDSHQGWEEGGIPLSPQEIEETIKQATGAGDTQANQRIYLNMLRLKPIPSSILDLISQVFSFKVEEVLDILMLPYARYWQIEMPQKKTSVIHCVDVSGSMREAMNNTISTMLSMLVAIQSMGNCLKQKVICVDVEKQFEWEGTDPDITLLKGLRELKGLGGTTFPNILIQELTKPPDILVVYSDMIIHYQALDSWEKIKKEIAPHIHLFLTYNPSSKHHWDIISPPKPQAGH